MDRASLSETARALVAPGKGILAADESSGTIKKRFDSIGVDSNEDNRRAYRELLFTTPGANDHISGVILFDETIRQSAANGTPFPQLLADQGVIPGIKVDTGAKALAGSEGETVTEGLDGLRERLAEYRHLGARFAKWRATYTITDDLPSRNCYDVNAHALARYAALCQEVDIVPIVEPEVLMDGTHTIERSAVVTTYALNALYRELFAQHVYLPGTLLKPNMVLSGYECPQQASDDEVADLTLVVFRYSVPAAVPGIVFLSGGQSDEQATARLSVMNQQGPLPWQLSFSYGRALQAACVLKAWLGETANIEAGQRAFAKRARLNGLARSGDYKPEMEQDAAQLAGRGFVRALIQRVTRASVTIDGEWVGSIGAGLCVLVGVTHADTDVHAHKLAEKVWQLRVFPDGDGVMNLPLAEAGGAALVVSQFTLYGDTTRGRRPSWGDAARPEQAEPLVDAFCAALRDLGATVATGRFGADMQVELVNDGPVTLLLEV